MCLYIYMYVCVCTRCVVYVYIILLSVCVSVSKYVKIHIHAGLGFDQVAKRAVVDDFWSFSLDSSDSKSPQAIPEHKWNEAPNSPFDSVMMRHDASCNPRHNLQGAESCVASETLPMDWKGCVPWNHLNTEDTEACHTMPLKLGKLQMPKANHAYTLNQS